MLVKQRCLQPRKQSLVTVMLIAHQKMKMARQLDSDIVYHININHLYCIEIANMSRKTTINASPLVLITRGRYGECL